MSYMEPKYGKPVFTCLYCNSNTQQNWNKKILQLKGDVYSLFDARGLLIYGDTIQSEDSILAKNDNKEKIFSVVTCHICHNFSIWLNNEIIYPRVSNIELPNQDMPEKIKELYMEAREVFPISKKACAALLRLALQYLCMELGGEGKNINTDIAKLVKEGLNPMIQKALDTIRITGNQAVHPGELEIAQDPEVVTPLFFLLNFIVEEKYTKPKKVEEFFSKMPKHLQEAVEKRDVK